MGTEIGMLGGYGFHGQVTAHDGSDKQGKMGAGYDNLRRKKKKQQSRYAAENRFEQICSRESLTEMAAETGKTIAVKEHEKERYDFDPTMFYENCFWNQRPDGIVINKYHRTSYILEFKQSSDRNENFLRIKEVEANEQHENIFEALKAAAPAWTFEQINFAARRCKANFYNKLERLNVQARKRDKILLAYVERICKAHDTVIRSREIHGLSGADATTSIKNIG